MSPDKKTPPILPTPVKPFTLRLVNGHFVRVPRLENLPATDATRPSATAQQKVSPHGDGEVLRRGLRLVNGRFVSGPEPEAPFQVPPCPGSVTVRQPPVPAEPSPDSWAYAFGTKVDPAGSPEKSSPQPSPSGQL